MNAKGPISAAVITLFVACASTQPSKITSVPPISLSIDAKIRVDAPPNAKQGSGSTPKDDRLGNWIFANVYGPDTLIGEIWLGCLSFYSTNERWPRSQEEIQEGFSLLQRQPVHLPKVERLAVHEDGEDLRVEVSIPGFPNGWMTVSKPVKKEGPNKAPEPTTMSVTPRASERDSK